MMKSNSRIKGVLIDFGDTLAYTDKRAYDTYVQEIFALVQKDKHGVSFDYTKSTFTSLYRRSSTGEIKNLQEFWSVFLQKLGIFDKKGLINELNQARNRFYIPAVRLYDGVASTLSVLQKKYMLALVSNCGVGTFDVIKALGLTRFFDVIVLSYEVGVRKPDERIYVEALKRMELKGDECVFVADEISDLEGARRLGMRTMLVRQGVSTFCEAEDLGFKPDFEVERVAQIVDFL
jgi:putative hydrolase of the HAD superfamily